jgi:hypothetical protein
MAYKKTPQYPPQKVAKGPSAPKSEVEEGRRVKDVQSARSIYDRMVADNDLRSRTIAQTRNQLEGGRPFDPAALEAQGAAWQTNVNFGDAQASRDRTLLPYWKMINDVPHKAAFTIESGAPQTEKYQAAFADAFDEFLKDWGADYFQQYMQMAANFVNYGPGIVQWGDDVNPRYKNVNVQRMYFPMNCQMSPDDWEVVALVRDMTASELYEKIRDPKTSERSEYAGWKKEAVQDFIIQSSNNGVMPDVRDYTRVSDKLVNNDIAVTTPFMPMPTVWLYVKQFAKPGDKKRKISCCVFTPNSGVDDFLFEDDDCAESFRHIFGPVWYNTGTDGMVHSIKGFGIKNYYFSALSNRMKSRFVDSATVSLGVNFQYNDSNTPDETPPVENYGPFTIFPNGLTQLSVYPQLQAASGVMQMLENNQSENNSLYRQQQQQIENSDTATQANILATMQGQLSEASASIYLSQVGENIFTEQVRRLRKRGNRNEDAKKFVKRLKDRGVPDEVIFEIDVRVATGANSSMANPAIRAQMFQQDLALMNLPGINSRWFLENLIANKYGAYAVTKALLPEGQDSQPMQRRQAIMENSDFGQGIMLPVAPSDAHYEHIQEHLKPLAGIVQAFKNNGQISPEQAPALIITLEHTGQHMQFLSQDETMKAQFQQVSPDFRLIQSIARGILTRMSSQEQGPQPVAAMTG